MASLNWRRWRARRLDRQLTLLYVQMPIAADRRLRHDDSADQAAELGQRVRLAAAERRRDLANRYISWLVPDGTTGVIATLAS